MFARSLLPTALLLATGCVPTTAAYLSIPVETADGAPRSAVELRVPLDRLAQRMDLVNPAELAFYAEGRSPVPRRLVDEDGDGAPDVALVVIPVAGNGSTRLVALCPGPTAEGAPPPAPRDPTVILRFDRSQH